MRAHSISASTLGRLLAGALALFPLLALATARVEVEFVKPENFTDGGQYGGVGENPQAVMQEFRQHLEKLGESCLPAGQSLQVRVLDIRLAGRVEWWHQRFNYQDVRILRDRADWPAMEIETTLKDAAGAVLAQQKDSLSAPGYLQTRASDPSQVSYRYEKAMMTRWFEGRFCPLGAQAKAPAPQP